MNGQTTLMAIQCQMGMNVRGYGQRKETTGWESKERGHRENGEKENTAG